LERCPGRPQRRTRAPLMKDDLPHKENCRQEARQANKRTHLRVRERTIGDIIPRLEPVEDGEIARSCCNKTGIGKLSFWYFHRKEIDQKRGGADEILGCTVVVKSQ